MENNKRIDVGDGYIQEQKKRFIDEFFTYKIKKYNKEDKRNVLTNVNIEPSRVELKRAVKSLYKKYKLTFEWDEFISIIMLLVTEAVYNFEPKNSSDFSWADINKIGTKSNMTLNKIVYKTYKTNIKDYQQKAKNSNRTSMRVIEGGKSVKKTAIIENKHDSIDIDLSLEDGETNVIQTLRNEDNQGYQNKLYHPNVFLYWFETNRDRLLSKSNKEFIDIMQKFLPVEGSNYTLPFNQDDTQPYTDTARRNRMYRIRKKVNELWEKEQDCISLLQMKKESDLSVMNELMYIVYDAEFDDIADMNKAVSKYIYEQLNNSSNTVLSDLLHDQLDIKDMKHINTVLAEGHEISNQIIYKVVALVEDKIEQLHKFDTAVSNQELHSNMSKTKERHQEYADYYYDFKNKPANVYDIKTGRLIRQEKIIRENKNYRVFRLDTFGTRLEKTEDYEEFD